MTRQQSLIKTNSGQPKGEMLSCFCLAVSRPHHAASQLEPTFIRKEKENAISEKKRTHALVVCQCAASLPYSTPEIAPCTTQVADLCTTRKSSGRRPSQSTFVRPDLIYRLCIVQFHRVCSKTQLRYSHWSCIGRNLHIVTDHTESAASPWMSRFTKEL